VRTRAVTKKVAAQKAERVTRAERRRRERAQSKTARASIVVGALSPDARVGGSECLGDESVVAPVTLEELTSPAAGRLWSMLERVQACSQSGVRGSPELPPARPG